MDGVSVVQKINDPDMDVSERYGMIENIPSVEAKVLVSLEPDIVRQQTLDLRVPVNYSEWLSQGVNKRLTAETKTAR